MGGKKETYLIDFEGLDGAGLEFEGGRLRVGVGLEVVIPEDNPMKLSISIISSEKLAATSVVSACILKESRKEEDLAAKYSLTSSSVEWWWWLL